MFVSGHSNGQLLDLQTVVVCDGGVQRNHRQSLEIRDLAFRVLPLPTGCCQCLPNLIDVGAAGDRIHQSADARLGIRRRPFERGSPAGNLAAALCAGLVPLADEDRDELGIQQLGLETVEHPLFKQVRHDRAIVRAASAVAVAAAAPAFAADDGPSAAAQAAHGDSAQHVLRPTRTFRAACGVTRAEGLRLLPCLLVDDTQLGRRVDDPTRLVIRLDPLLARRRVGALARARVHQLAGVKAVLEHAVPALPVAVERAGAPRASSWRLHLLAVQRRGYRARALAGDIFSEDAADDRRLVRIDIAQAANGLAAIVEARHLAIAISQSCGRAPLLDRAALPAFHALGQILPELGGEQALERPAHVVDLALQQGEQPRAGVRKAFANGEVIALVPRDTVRRLGKQLLGLAGLDPGQGSIEAGARALVDAGGAIDRLVLIGRDDFPALMRATLAAERELIVSAAWVLQRRAEAGVDDRAHGGRGLGG